MATDKIETYQIEIRGRVTGTYNLLGGEWKPLARYEVIAGSYQEATDLIREFENNGRAEHGLVKCTMRMA